MLMPDVNVLVYAHRPEEQVHDFYRKWLEAVVTGPEPFALSVLVMAGFVRVVTRPGLFDEPTPLTVALAAIEALREQEGCRIVGPGTDHPSHFDRCCRRLEPPASSSQVPSTPRSPSSMAANG